MNNLTTRNRCVRKGKLREHKNENKQRDYETKRERDGDSSGCCPLRRLDSLQVEFWRRLVLFGCTNIEARSWVVYMRLNAHDSSLKPTEIFSSYRKQKCARIRVYEIGAKANVANCRAAFVFLEPQQSLAVAKPSRRIFVESRKSVVNDETRIHSSR